MGTKLCGLALACAVAFGAPGAAVAHDHTSPEALLVTTTDSGPGTNYSTIWSQRSGRWCATLAADGIPAYGPTPVQWVPGTDIAVRFVTRHKPARVRATAYLLGDPTTGTPIYGSTPVPHELRRVEVDGKVMWEAVLDPPPAADLYLDVVAHWRDQDGCGMQEAAWSFRASLLPI